MLRRNRPRLSTLREKSGPGVGGMGDRAMGVGKDKTTGGMHAPGTPLHQEQRTHV